MPQKTIILKTLDQKQYVFDGYFSMVEDLMVRIENDLNHPKDCQQLIYAGKILNSDDNIPDMNEKSFLVLLIKKTRKKEPPTENTDSIEPSTDTLTEEPIEIPTEETTKDPENTSPQHDSQENIPENPAGNSDFINSVVPDDNMIQNSQQITEEQVLQMMEQNPQVFQQLLSGLCQQQPEIANLVQNDPQSFISFLTQVINQSGLGDTFTNPLPNEINDNIENNLHIEEDTRQLSEHIQMTEEEHLNMESLIQMFPHIPQVTILETLRACSNDQTATANLLFEY